MQAGGHNPEKNGSGMPDPYGWNDMVAQGLKPCRGRACPSRVLDSRLCGNDREYVGNGFKPFRLDLGRESYGG